MARLAGEALRFGQAREDKARLEAALAEERKVGGWREGGGGQAEGTSLEAALAEGTRMVCVVVWSVWQCVRWTLELFTAL